MKYDTSKVTDRIFSLLLWEPVHGEPWFMPNYVVQYFMNAWIKGGRLTVWILDFCRTMKLQLISREEIYYEQNGQLRWS